MSEKQYSTVRVERIDRDGVRLTVIAPGREYPLRAMHNRRTEGTHPMEPGQLWQVRWLNSGPNSPDTVYIIERRPIPSV
jgi:hypothetical protein